MSDTLKLPIILPLSSTTAREEICFSDMSDMAAMADVSGVTVATWGGPEEGAGVAGFRV